MNRNTIIIYGLIGVAAALYAWGATARADRDALTAWGSTACAAAGVEFTPQRGERGAACTARVMALAKLNRENTEATAKVLADALSEQHQLANADLTAATKQMEAAAAAVKLMDQENAKIGQTDHVGSDWFIALNRLGGLRAPATR